MRYLLLSVLFLFVQEIRAQFIEDISDDRPLKALASGEIQLLNLTQSTIEIQYSLDKEVWKTKNVRSRDGIIATLSITDARLHVKICSDEGETILCDQYPLRPKRRYVIDVVEGKMVIRGG